MTQNKMPPPAAAGTFNPLGLLDPETGESLDGSMFSNADGKTMPAAVQRPSVGSKLSDTLDDEDAFLWDAKRLWGIGAFGGNCFLLGVSFYAATFTTDRYSELVTGYPLVPPMGVLLLTQILLTAAEVRAPADAHPGRPWHRLRRFTTDEFSPDELAHSAMLVVGTTFNYVSGNCHASNSMECWVNQSLFASFMFFFLLCAYWFMWGLRRAIRSYQGRNAEHYCAGLAVRWGALILLEWGLFSLAVWNSAAGAVGDDLENTAGSFHSVLFESPGYPTLGYNVTCSVGLHFLCLSCMFEMCFGAGLISGARLWRLRLETHEVFVGALIGMANATATFMIMSVFTTEYGDTTGRWTWFVNPFLWVCWLTVMLAIMLVIGPRNLLMQRATGPSGFHIFLSYRRAQTDFADRIKRGLERYGYRVFFDVDPNSGLEGGNFQEHLEDVLWNTPVVIPVFTPPPSGSNWRKDYSSLAVVKEACKRAEEAEAKQKGARLDMAYGVQTFYNGRLLRPGEAAPEGVEPELVPFYDFCERELTIAFNSGALVLPVFKPGMDIGAELWGLPKTLSQLPDMNARVLHDDLFDSSLEVIHMFIQRHFSKKEV